MADDYLVGESDDDVISTHALLIVNRMLDNVIIVPY